MIASPTHATAAANVSERTADGPTAAARTALLLTLLTSGLSAGLFYGFAAAVTPGLATVGDHTYVEAFQGINAIIRNLPFGIAFFGPVVLAAATLVLRRRGGRTTWLIAAGLAIYVVGVLGITFGFHVPRNEQLATYADLAATDLTAVRAWFEAPWNTGNVVRTVAACAAFGLFAVATSTAATDRDR